MGQEGETGDGEYMSRYFFYDSYDIPGKYEETVPQVFPTTAPGNFTYLPELQHYVLTTFLSLSVGFELQKSQGI